MAGAWWRESQHFGLVEVREEDATQGTVLVYQVAALHELVSWLLSWGSQVEVLEPPELRAELAQTAASRTLSLADFSYDGL